MTGPEPTPAAVTEMATDSVAEVRTTVSVNVVEFVRLPTPSNLATTPIGFGSSVTPPTVTVL
jgi:hypothetical protein